MNTRDIEKEFTQASNQYSQDFWSVLKSPSCISHKITRKMKNIENGSYEIPTSTLRKLDAKIKNISKFRNIATVVKNYKTSNYIDLFEPKDYIEWVKNYNVEFMQEDILKETFRKIPLSYFTIACMIKLSSDFILDNEFNLEDFLINEFAKKYVPFENEAFINGDGKTMPTGILANEGGAEVALKVDNITLDDVKKLFFSLDPKYRENGTWLMNDETALYLQSLKDSSGNYLWQGFDSSLMGKPVIVDNSMPLAQEGAKPIAFGDFSNYWIVERGNPTIKNLNELFSLSDEIAYLSFKYLDGKLVRPDSVKVIQISE